MRRECQEHFPHHEGKRSWHASRHVRDARAVLHAGIANWRFPLKSAVGGKRSRHSRRMRNPQFYVSGKRPMNATLLLHEGQSVATILSYLKYSISSLNHSSVLPINLCWFYGIHFGMWHSHCRKINADHIVITKELIYKHQIWNENIYICVDQL